VGGVTTSDRGKGSKSLNGETDRFLDKSESSEEITWETASDNQIGAYRESSYGRIYQSGRNAESAKALLTKPE
jgi:hypothetical protein